MTIDIICICHKSYWLFDQQIKHWENYMKGDFRLVLLDSTPDYAYQPFYYHGKLVERFFPSSDFDGINSGESYDYAISQCTSDIIGFTDPDNFFLNPNLLEEIEVDFIQGYRNVGCQGFYDDWCRIIDLEYPDFAGWKAPILWGMFMDRGLAASESWVCLPPGRGQVTSWKVRKRVIDEGIPNKVWPGFYSDYGPHGGITFFGDKERPTSVHFLKGSGGRSHIMETLVPPVLEREKAKWTTQK